MWRMNICVFIHQLPLLTGRDALEGIKTPHFQAVSVYALIWSLASEGPEVESTDRHSLLEARHCQHESTPVYTCPKHLLLELAVSKGDGTWSDWNVPITVRERSNNATGSILPSPSLWNSLICASDTWFQKKEEMICQFPSPINQTLTPWKIAFPIHPTYTDMGTEQGSGESYALVWIRETQGRSWDTSMSTMQPAIQKGIWNVTSVRYMLCVCTLRSKHR